MAQITLKNVEVLNLQKEIEDALPKISKDGQPLKLNLDYLFEKSVESLKAFNKLKEDFLKEKGTPASNGNYTIQQVKDTSLPLSEDNISDEFKEFSELLNQEVSITFKLIPLSYFEKLISEDYYPTIRKFIEF